MKATQLFCLVSFGVLAVSILLNILSPIIQNRIEKGAQKRRVLMKKLNKIITGAVCAAAASAGLTISARAADTVLTPQQTLALLGTEFEIEYFNSNTNVTSSHTAQFLGTTDNSDLWLWNEQDNLVPNTKIPFYTRPLNFEDYNYTSALIYGVTVPFDIVSYNQADRYNINFSFPFELEGLVHFEMPIFYSKRSVISQDARTNAILNTSLGVQTFNRASGNGRMYMYNAPDKTDGSSGLYLGMLPVNYSTDNDNLFSVNSLFLGLNLCDSISSAYIDGLASGWYRFYIFVECPIIDGWSPSTTTAPQTTTRPQTYTTRPHDYTQYATTPANTVDLSQIEENQRIQIEIENDNRNYNAGTYDGINIIIDQLNDIYAQMQARGEIAVDLLDGVHPDFLSSDMRADVRNALSSHTTARLPDVQSGKTFSARFLTGSHNFAMLQRLRFSRLLLALLLM